MEVFLSLLTIALCLIFMYVQYLLSVIKGLKHRNDITGKRLHHCIKLLNLCKEDN